MTKKHWLYVTLLMLLMQLSSAVFAITPLPPDGASAQPQGCSATASCGTGQVASARPVKPVGVALPGWCSNPDKTAVEQMICSVPDIAKLDNDLNRLYQVSPNPDMVASRRAERDACQTAECVRQWYQKWLAQMTMGDQQPQSYQPPAPRQPLPTVTQYAPPQPFQAQPLQQPMATGGISWCGNGGLSQAESRLCQLSQQDATLAQLDQQLNERHQQRKFPQQKRWLQQRDQLVNGGAPVAQIKQFYQQRLGQ